MNTASPSGTTGIVSRAPAPAIARHSSITRPRPYRSASRPAVALATLPTAYTRKTSDDSHDGSPASRKPTTL
ncbi:hypothetical protein Lesp02_79520 [Lentzea sp. NBRC 105346]|nr:hypothetical protein Lesp02_79520 [Lentzea sp. NBRC 105346]